MTGQVGQTAAAPCPREGHNEHHQANGSLKAACSCSQMPKRTTTPTAGRVVREELSIAGIVAEVENVEEGRNKRSSSEHKASGIDSVPGLRDIASSESCESALGDQRRVARTRPRDLTQSDYNRSKSRNATALSESNKPNPTTAPLTKQRSFST